MSKNTGSSWLPKSGSTWVKRKEAGSPWIGREAGDGKFTIRPVDKTRIASSSTNHADVVTRVANAVAGKIGSGEAAGKITLPNGHQISTVRRDVLDRALGRVTKRDK